MRALRRGCAGVEGCHCGLEGDAGYAGYAGFADIEVAGRENNWDSEAAGACGVRRC